jgi:hypothetical protein
MIINAAVKEELEIVRVSNGGRLTPASVLEYAQDESTALWKCIDEAGLWDDSVAAEKARLSFCQHVIIRVRVSVIDNGKPINIRAYVNLANERRTEEGGYRLISEVASTDEGQEQLLETALGELKAFRNKYALLKQLAPILASIDWHLDTMATKAEKPAANGKAGAEVVGTASSGPARKRRRATASHGKAVSV